MGHGLPWTMSVPQKETCLLKIQQTEYTWSEFTTFHFKALMHLFFDISDDAFLVDDIGQ